jgi:hypothetical protein
MRNAVLYDALVVAPSADDRTTIETPPPQITGAVARDVSAPGKHATGNGVQSAWHLVQLCVD